MIAAITALLDEYKRAISELKSVISPLSDVQLVAIVDAETDDEDCKSVQTILTHVVQSGHRYALEIRKWQGEKTEMKLNYTEDNVASYKASLDSLIAFNEKLFADYPNIKLEESIEAQKLAVSWGQTYDVEQLMEHAIVHVLRHRRQVESFILKLKTKEM